MYHIGWQAGLARDCTAYHEWHSFSWISHETRIIVSRTAEDIAVTQLQPLAVCYGLLFVSYSMLLATPSWAVHARVTRVATIQHCELSSHAFVHMYFQG